MTLTTLHLSKPDRIVTLREQGEGEALVLIHGVGMQSAAWGPQIKELSKSRRVIAVDMPGHGGSSRLGSGSGLPAYVDWLRDVVEQLNLDRCSIAGHSMGALITAGFAVEHPERTQRVALLNGVFRRTPEARAAVISRAAEIQAGKIDRETPLKRWFGDTTIEREARAQVAGWLNDLDPQGYATAYAAFAQSDATYADRFSAITAPFLAITGSDDPNSTPAMSEAMAAAVQNGRSISIKRHRHMVNLTAPEVVTAHLSEWLALPTPEMEPQ